MQAIMTVPLPEPEREAVGLELVGKVGAVLTALERHGELTAAELAAATGEPLSSIYRLIRSLGTIGWLEKGPRRGLYRLGLYFMTVGGRLEESIDIREAALPALRFLLAETGATSYLCLRRGSRAVCVERLEGLAVRSLAMQLGSSLPLYAGAAPRALLAFLPEAEQEALLRDSVVQPGDPSRPSNTAIRSDIRRTIRDGYTVSDGDVTSGIAALGVPIFNHRGELVAAISISGLRSHIIGPGRDANIQLLRRAARTASRALGFVVPEGQQ
jgi:DNA-binding IclR family transcriptional regulator